MTATALSIVQGGSFAEPFQWNNPDGSPVNLTGWTAHLQARRAPGGLVILDASTTNGMLTIPTPADGTVNIALTAIETAALPVGVFGYDLHLIGSTATVVLLSGQLTVTPGFTVDT